MTDALSPEQIVLAQRLRAARQRVVERCMYDKGGALMSIPAKPDDLDVLLDEAADALIAAAKREGEMREERDKAIRRLAEIAEPGNIGIFGSRDHWKARAESAEAEARQPESPGKERWLDRERIESINDELASIQASINEIPHRVAKLIIRSLRAVEAIVGEDIGEIGRCDNCGGLLCVDGIFLTTNDDCKVCDKCVAHWNKPARSSAAPRGRA